MRERARDDEAKTKQEGEQGNEEMRMMKAKTRVKVGVRVKMMETIIGKRIGKERNNIENKKLHVDSLPSDQRNTTIYLRGDTRTLKAKKKTKKPSKGNEVRKRNKKHTHTHTHKTRKYEDKSKVRKNRTHKVHENQMNKVHFQF